MDGLLSTDTSSSTEVVVDPNVDSGDEVNDHDKGKIDNMVSMRVIFNVDE